MRIIKENQLKIENQVLKLDCNIEISVRKSNAKVIFEIFDNLYEVKIKKIND